jgi:hypothetical protein
MSTPDRQEATAHAILTASGVTACFVLAELLGLTHANLAAWTTYMVMAQYTFTRFQKGVERVVGRGAGILAGLVLVTWFRQSPVLALAMIGVLLTAFFYFYFAGRLAYTFLNAGLYVVAVFELGMADPGSAVTVAEGLFAAVVLGVVVAILVSWISGAERDVRIKPGHEPLLPLRGSWLNQSVMLAVTVILTALGARALGLPPDKAAISVLLLTIAPHLQGLIFKGELRIVGLLLAVAWGLATFLIVGLLPHFIVLAAMLFLGELMADYLTTTSGQYAYAGLQMGLVLPMVVVASPDEFGSLTLATQRLEGILLGLLTSILVAGLWPFFPAAKPVQPTPPPSVFAGEMDV